MTPIVTPRQLCEHLHADILNYVTSYHFDSMILPSHESLSGKAVRLDRVPGGFVVTHGKYMDLRRMNTP